MAQFKCFSPELNLRRRICLLTPSRRVDTHVTVRNDKRTRFAHNHKQHTLPSVHHHRRSPQAHASRNNHQPNKLSLLKQCLDAEKVVKCVTLSHRMLVELIIDYFARVSGRAVPSVTARFFVTIFKVCTFVSLRAITHTYPLKQVQWTKIISFPFAHILLFRYYKACYSPSCPSWRCQAYFWPHL
jgi:hypothetical protein